MQAIRVSEPSPAIAIASPEYLKYHPAPRTPQDLQNHNCIALSSRGLPHEWDFAKGKQRVEMAINGSLVVSTMDLVVQAVLDGIGIGFTLESHVSAHIARGRIVPLLTDWSAERHSYYLYYAGRRQLPLPLKVFIAFLQQSRRLA
jgi:DNA-binding transcriptional LysR family regulator